VGTRPVQRCGVSVHSHVTKRPVEKKELTLGDEHGMVEHSPVDRAATEVDLAAVQEGTIEVKETNGEPVLKKRARVVEGVVIGKEVEQRTETGRETGRRRRSKSRTVGSR